MTFLFIAILGVCVGSFLNVIIFRTQTGGSVVHGRSMCQTCKIQLRFFDLIPICSFVFLKAKCRACKSKISWQYPIVECATALLFILMYLKQTLGLVPVSSLLLLRDWVFVSFLIVIFVYDLKYMYILDLFTIPAMVIAVIFNVWLGQMYFATYIIGAIIIGGFFFLQFFVSKGKWVGGGDIRLGILIGLMLGLAQGLVALFLAYIFGSIIGLILLSLKKVDRKTEIPFGTFLTATTVIGLFCGPSILNLYIGLFSV